MTFPWDFSGQIRLLWGFSADWLLQVWLLLKVHFDAPWFMRQLWQILFFFIKANLLDWGAFLNSGHMYANLCNLVHRHSFSWWEFSGSLKALLLLTDREAMHLCAAMFAAAKVWLLLTILSNRLLIVFFSESLVLCQGLYFPKVFLFRVLPWEYTYLPPFVFLSGTDLSSSTKELN